MALAKKSIRGVMYLECLMIRYVITIFIGSSQSEIRQQVYLTWYDYSYRTKRQYFPSV